MRGWIFVVNKKKYSGNVMDWWQVRQHAQFLEDAIGDTVYIYSTGEGIIRYGMITRKAELFKQPFPNFVLQGWCEKERLKLMKLNEIRMVPIETVPYAGKPLNMKDMKIILGTSSAFINKNAQGTNFILNHEEATKMDQFVLNQE